MVDGELGGRRGRVFADRFELEEFADSGGMGVVYRALDRVSGLRVALKVLVSAEGDHPERFVREGRTLAGLEHPHIVGYVAHGLSPAGELYLAMEWLEGENLATRLAKQGLSVRESIDLVGHAAEALVSAHARGIVHRDLKPSNLFLVGGDVQKVKLVDFGIAKTLFSWATRSVAPGRTS
jgi:serine/threonine protein kinase